MTAPENPTHHLPNALNKLRDENLTLRLATEAAQLVIWQWDVVSGTVFLSPRWEIFTGKKTLSNHQTIDALLRQVHPDDVSHIKNSVQDLLKGRSERYTVEHRVQSEAGWVWIESNGIVSQRDSYGKVTQITGTNANINRQKFDRDQLAVAQARAELSSQAKSDFLANMSHEVRTPLNAIMGLTRLLHQSQPNAQQSQYLAMIDDSATALLALLNDVLDLSKIEAGKLVFENVRFNLHEWVSQAVESLALQAREKNLRVELDIANDTPHQLMGDPGRLRQVLSNLMSNAVKFTAMGSITIKVWTGKNQEKLENGQLRVLFQIRDTGIGMTPEQQRNIFDAFAQADASTTRRFGGTGLGLAICQRLVKMMHGRIKVVSEPNLGSVFRFSAVFGVAPAQHSQLTMPAAFEAASLAGLRVLVAEDHPVNQMIMRKLLEEMGCFVEVVGDGYAVINRWKKGGIDLILMDIQMPGMGGEEATAQIRAIEASNQSHLPIVALTAHALAGDREKYLSQGMDAYVSKPVSPDALALAILTAIDLARQTPTELLSGFNFASPLSVSTPAPKPPSEQKEDSPIDTQQLLRRLGGDEAVLQEIAQAMLVDLTTRLPLLQNALMQRDSALAVDQSHALKGALASMAIERGANLAKQLELAGRHAQWNLYAAALVKLYAEVEKIEFALKRIALKNS